MSTNYVTLSRLYSLNLIFVAQIRQTDGKTVECIEAEGGQQQYSSNLGSLQLNSQCVGEEEVYFYICSTHLKMLLQFDYIDFMLGYSAVFLLYECTSTSNKPYCILSYSHVLSFIHYK